MERREAVNLLRRALFKMSGGAWSIYCGVDWIYRAFFPAYISGWASKLRDNQKWILWAASRAEKAADHILGIVSEEHIPADSSEVEILEPAMAE